MALCSQAGTLFLSTSFFFPPHPRGPHPSSNTTVSTSSIPAIPNLSPPPAHRNPHQTRAWAPSWGAGETAHTALLWWPCAHAVISGCDESLPVLSSPAASETLKSSTFRSGGPGTLNRNLCTVGSGFSAFPQTSKFAHLQGSLDHPQGSWGKHCSPHRGAAVTTLRDKSKGQGHAAEGTRAPPQASASLCTSQSGLAVCEQQHPDGADTPKEVLQLLGGPWTSTPLTSLPWCRSSPPACPPCSPP